MGDAINTLRYRGYRAPDNATEGNVVYHYLSHAEAHIVRRVLFLIRRNRLLFSRGLVHDALVVHDCVPAHEVLETAGAVASDLGFPRVKFVLKSWDKPIQRAKKILRDHSFSPNSRILPTAFACPPRSVSTLDHIVDVCIPGNLWASGPK